MEEYKYTDYSNEKLTEAQFQEVIKTSLHPKKHVLSELVLLEKNANIMSKEKFDRLVENIKRDGRLTQWPFVMKMPDGKYAVPSGNHRIKAAIQAGIQEEWCATLEVTVSRDDVLRWQISHNAIHGEQANIVLYEITEEFKDIDLLRMSGADFDLEKIDTSKLDFQSIDSGNLDFREVIFYFTDFELNHIDKVFDDIGRKMDLTDNPVYFLDKKKQKKFIDVVTKAKQGANIKSSSTVLSLMIDYLYKNKEQFIQSLQPEKVKSDTIENED